MKIIKWAVPAIALCLAVTGHIAVAAAVIAAAVLTLLLRADRPGQVLATVWEVTLISTAMIRKQILPKRG